jgi:hypothetical protein
MVVATVAKKATKGDVDHAPREFEGGALLMGQRLHSGRVDTATYLHLARVDINAHQYVRGSAQFGNSEDQASSWIIDGCAGDPEGVNVSARKLCEWNRPADVSMPLYLSSACVKRVERVSFGGDEHMATNDQWLGIHGAVQACTPGTREPLWVRFICQVACPAIVVVIGGPIGAVEGWNRGGRCSR